jgi:hypothetical protein
MELLSKEKVTKLLKLGFYFISRLLFYFFLAVLFNWILFIFLFPELKILFPLEGGRVAHAGGPAVILALFLLLALNWKGTLLILSFLFIFPLIHFLFLKKFLLSKILEKMIREYKLIFLEYLLGKFYEYLESKNILPTASILLETLPKFFSKLNNLPFGLKSIAKFYLSKVHFLENLQEGLTLLKEDMQPKEQIHVLVNYLNQKSNLEIYEASFFINWMLYLFNFVIFLLIKIFVN